MNTGYVKVALAAAALGWAGSAAAQFYAGGAIGQGHVRVECEGIPSCDRTGTGFKVYGGWRWHPNVAVELKHIDFGRARARDADLGLGVTIDGAATGVGLSASADFSPRVYGVARVGAARARAKIGASLAGLRASVSDTSTQPYVGFAIGWSATKNLGVELGLDTSKIRYRSAELEIDESASVRLISVGVNYRF